MDAPKKPAPNHDVDRQLIELFVRHQDLLYGYIRSLLPCFEDADDVFQETSLVLWEKRASYDASRGFIAWSYGIARNVASNYVRKKRNRGVTLSPELFAAVESARLQSAGELQSYGEWLNRCLSHLSESQRKFVMRCYSSKKSLSWVASQMGISENALYIRLSRIRKRLLDCLRRSMHREETA